jgi:hypothetical protein
MAALAGSPTKRDGTPGSSSKLRGLAKVEGGPRASLPIVVPDCGFTISHAPAGRPPVLGSKRAATDCLVMTTAGRRSAMKQGIGRIALLAVCGLALLSTGVIAGGRGQSPAPAAAPANVVRAQRFELVDKQGRPRMRMFVDDGDAAVLEVLDAKGRATFRLPCEAHGRLLTR